MRIFAWKTGVHDSRSSASAAAYRLLSYAVKSQWGTDCPRILRPAGGKPRFEGDTGMCFSISHSGDYVLAAVHDSDVGVDIEKHRAYKEGLAGRIFSEKMLNDFGFFDGWVLRESVFKLMGEGSLMDMEIEKRGEDICTPFAGVKCRLYDALPGYSVAAACTEGELPGEIYVIEGELF